MSDVHTLVAIILCMLVFETVNLPSLNVPHSCPVLFLSLELFSNLLSSEGGVVSSEGNFVSSIMEVGSELPSDVFDSLAKHLSVCGAERRKKKQREQRG